MSKIEIIKSILSGKIRITVDRKIDAVERFYISPAPDKLTDMPHN